MFNYLLYSKLYTFWDTAALVLLLVGLSDCFSQRGGVWNRPRRIELKKLDYKVRLIELFKKLQLIELFKKIRLIELF